MDEPCSSRFPGNLDPRAQEFRPHNINNNPTQLTLLPPLHIFYPYATTSLPLPPPPPPPPPPLPPYMQNDLHVMSYNELPPGCNTSYQTFHMPLVSPPVGFVNPPSLPPPSSAPTRALVLTPLPIHVSESRLRRELEVYGEIRAVQLERILDGIVTVHFYDLRHAEKAMKEIREQHMQQQNKSRNPHNRKAYPSENYGPLISGRPVWAQYTIPAYNALPEGNNQGSLVIFNLHPDVSNNNLKDIFQAYGQVKELRETPYKKHQKFIEFYDIRDASKALKEMSGKEIHGHKVFIEFSRPGGLCKKFLHSTPSFRPPPPPPPPPLPSLPPEFPYHHSISYNISSNYQPFSNKRNPNNNQCSIEPSMASLSIMDNSTTAARKENAKMKKPITKNRHNHTKSTDTKPWKNKHFRKFDTRFVIKEDEPVESDCRNSWTTVMIKNIPNKYSQKLLLNMLDNHCVNWNEQIGGEGDAHQPLSSYDFVYLPIDFNNKCNMGYGFVNMTSPEATLRLYKAFNLQHWEVFNTSKICEVTYARVQGVEALKEHFKNSKFPCQMDHNYLPVMFSPPRDGVQLTEPIAIVGLNQHECSDEMGNLDLSHDEEKLDGGYPSCDSDQIDNDDSSLASGGNGGEISYGDEDYELQS